VSVRVAGAEVILDASGIAWLPAEGTAVVADLHLEKASSYAGYGRFLPPYDTSSTLARLAAALARLSPERVICLGDSSHDGGGPRRLGAADRARLAGLVAAHEWIWVVGNHDPELPADIGGSIVAECALGCLTFRHVPGGPAQGEVAGHLHPFARVRGRGGAVRRRAFLTNGRRLVLPAFGALTGGLDALDPAFRPLFPDRRFEAIVIGATRLYRIPAQRLG